MPVDRLMPPLDAPSSSLAKVTFWAAPDWLEMMNTTGPPPNEGGETRTREVSIAAVTLIGAGGRGLFA